MAAKHETDLSVKNNILMNNWICGDEGDEGGSKNMLKLNMQ